MSPTPLAASLNGHGRPPDPSPERIWTDRRTPLDRAAVERAAGALLTALGADLDSDGLRDTPRRMTDAYTELLTPEPFNLTTFPNGEGYDELIVVRVKFTRRCKRTAGIDDCCR